MMSQKMMILGSIAKMKLRDLFTDEKGEVNIVAIVILIGIAVILALIFKDQIKALLETLFGTITKKSNRCGQQQLEEALYTAARYIETIFVNSIPLCTYAYFLRGR